MRVISGIYEENELEKLGLRKIGAVGDGLVRFDNGLAEIYIMKHEIVNDEAGSFYKVLRCHNVKENETQELG